MKVETIGDATLYCGDCLEILPTLSGVDAVVTDPPYSSGGFTRGDRTMDTRTKYQSSDVAVGGDFANFAGDNRDQRSWAYWMALWLGEAMRASKPGAMLVTFTDWRQLPSTTDSIQAGGWVWRGVAVWDKVNGRPMPNRFRQSAEFIVWGTNGPKEFDTTGADYHDGVFQVAPPPTSDREHSTQKPTTLLDKLVVVSPPAGLVLDPFMGSGTTGISCINTGRRFVGVEMTEHYFDVACRRIEEAYRSRPRLFDTESAEPTQGSLL